MNELVVGDFLITPAAHQVDIVVKVTDPDGVEVVRKEREKEGKFAFTASKQGEFRVCFSNLAMSQRTVEFSFKTGVGAKDYTTVAKKDNLKPLEVELRRLEDMTGQLHQEMLEQQDRFGQMRRLSERTHSRLLFMSFMSLGILAVLYVIQTLYLRAFFRKKKLID